jgi:lambda family phage portal protein
MAGRRPIPARHSEVKASRNAGSYRGSLSAWRPPLTSTLDQQINERFLGQARAADLSVNDWAANSGLNSIATNAVGTGLKPQSRINYKRLGISRDQARELQNDIEAIWAAWTPRAHVRGMLHFEDIQFLGLRTMLRLGELVHLPVMRKAIGSPLELAIQDLSPTRLKTPLDKRFDSSVVDGVELDQFGAPAAYWLATPGPAIGGVYDPSMLLSSQFTRVPAKIGHRPGCFHLFRYHEEEQIRGESMLRPGINLFRHLSDSLDNELLAQVVTSSMAMFIAKEPGTPLPDYIAEEKEGEKKVYHQEIPAGVVVYGNDGEKPHMLETSRPSPNWAVFCEFVLRAMAASIDMPYEVLAKDFSKTNYSSARAALLEAWRVFILYRTWLIRHFCQPIWEMVIEEAWLNGSLAFPAGAPDFYDAMTLYTQATWIGPSRGYVDPVKEIAATITALENRLMTYSEAIAERGRDFDEVMDEREEEEERLATFPEIKKAPSSNNPAASFDDKEERDNVAV